MATSPSLSWDIRTTLVVVVDVGGVVGCGVLAVVVVVVAAVVFVVAGLLSILRLMLLWLWGCCV